MSIVAAVTLVIVIALVIGLILLWPDLQPIIRTPAGGGDEGTG